MCAGQKTLHTQREMHVSKTLVCSSFRLSSSLTTSPHSHSFPGHGLTWAASRQGETVSVMTSRHSAILQGFPLRWRLPSGSRVAQRAVGVLGTPNPTSSSPHVFTSSPLPLLTPGHPTPHISPPHTRQCNERGSQQSHCHRRDGRRRADRLPAHGSLTIVASVAGGRHPHRALQAHLRARECRGGARSPDSMQVLSTVLSNHVVVCVALMGPRALSWSPACMRLKRKPLHPPSRRTPRHHDHCRHQPPQG